MALNNKGANVQANTIQQYPTIALNIQTKEDMERIDQFIWAIPGG